MWTEGWMFIRDSLRFGELAGPGRLYLNGLRRPGARAKVQKNCGFSARPHKRAPRTRS